jgi:hypothetical protein
MDTKLLVDEQIDAGKALITALAQDGFDVAVALWIKPSDEDLWFLYLGSSSVDPAHIGDAYRRVYDCLRRDQHSTLGLSEIKLVPSSTLIAKDAIEVRDRSTARIPTRYHGKRLGGMAIDEAFIYPRIAGPMATTEVVQTVVGLMNRTGVVSPSTVTFQDGTSIKAIPAGIEAEPPGGVSIILIDVTSGQKKTFPANEVINIQ